MGLKDMWNTLRKGVKAGMLAVSNNNLNDNRVIELIRDFNSSTKRQWMEIGEKYYEVDNDIMDRKITKLVDGVEVEMTNKANNKLAHGKYKTMVDEKINYLFSRDYSLDCKDNVYIEKLKDTLGKHFQYLLSELGYEATNKGISWLQPYVNEEGQFKMMVIPSEQCIPVWKDNSHTELAMMIRVYCTTAYENNQKKTITDVEVWEENKVQYYRLDNKNLVPYTNMNYVNDEVVGHFANQEGKQMSWGKVPFIPFKNNRKELPDIKFVKSLLDNYDLCRSDAANYVEETNNLIYILKGYDGENLSEFVNRLNVDRAIPVDEDGGVETLTPTMDISALREHYEQLKRDIEDIGQSVNKDLDKIGNSPSGIALRFMYAGLDLKANAIETQFKFGFENLLYFINVFLNSKHVDVNILFNRDMEINESEVIDNCGKSKGIISDSTIMGNHPWVSDIEAEEKKMEEQKKEEMPQWDKVPLDNPINTKEEDKKMDEEVDNE